jgi:hypothetical protein
MSNRDTFAAFYMGAVEEGVAGEFLRRFRRIRRVEKVDVLTAAKRALAESLADRCVHNAERYMASVGR